jgi:hypothetical protein
MFYTAPGDARLKRNDTRRLSIFLMGTSDVLRHQRIKHLVTRHTDDAASVAVGLWAQMAVQIVSIIGENGFHSLYARSVLLAQPQFPWLVIDPPLAGDCDRFVELKKCFEGQIPAQVNEANVCY